MDNNPLLGYFRRPAIYIKLPSNGKFWPAGTIEFPENNEFPVYPMTAIDEISYRTPDALFNGQATVDVIQSCIPHIKNAWAVPSIDLDSLLVSIRIASYGHSMDIDTTCPSCKEESTYSLDLRSVIDNLKTPNFNKSIIIGDLEFHFKPLTYKQITDNNIIRFEEQKLLNVLADSEIDETQKLEMLSNAFKKITELTVKAVRQGIGSIKTPDSLVDDARHIDEFLHNCERNVFERLRDHIIDLKTQSELQPLKIVCNSCNHQYSQPFTLDMTNFFVQE